MAVKPIYSLECDYMSNYSDAFASTFNWLVLHLLPYLNVVDDQWCNVYTCSLLKKYAAVIISEKNIAIKIYIGLYLLSP